MSGWKNSFERLSKHKYVACIIHPKKVVCIYDKTIKLNRKWEEDYLNRHVRRSGCKANEGQRTIYNWFQLVKQNEYIEEEDEYDLDIYDNMDDDDLIQVDKIENDSDNEFQAVNIKERFSNTKRIKKWLICAGLQSVEISEYIKRTPAQFGVRAKTCTGIAEQGNICIECGSIRYDKNLCNKIAHPLPLPGYHFDYNCGNLSESTLEILKLWPIDEQISQTIKHSHRLACELAKFLNIMQPIDDSFSPNSQIFVSIHEEEVSTHSNNQIINFTNNEKQDQKILLNNSFQEGSLQLNIINHPFGDYSILYNENHRNISNALAQIHAKELTQSKKHKSIKKPKSFIQ
ncbi:974_t:CDS:2, partial [Racocetra fulgida]